MKKETVYTFDFDGTLTTRDTLLLFISFARGRWFLFGSLLLFSPLIVAMKLRLLGNGRVKQWLFSWCFQGTDLAAFDRLCHAFAASHRHILRVQGMDCVRQALDAGHRVLIVSASIENWVRPFFGELPVTLLCTGIETKDGTLTGRFCTPNCHGQEKVRRISSLLPERNHYALTAFGDSRGDREMLAMADEAHYKPFRQ